MLGRGVRVPPGTKPGVDPGGDDVDPVGAKPELETISAVDDSDGVITWVAR